MSFSLSVSWAVLAPALHPCIHCARCGTRRPFAPSGRARVNANGSRLDAWLIYRCSVCGATWNLPLFERRPLSQVDPAYLADLTGNAPALMDSLARDRAALCRHTDRIEPAMAPQLRRRVLSRTPADTPALHIGLHAVEAVPLRPDRLLAAELGITRSRLRVWADSGRLTATRPGRNPLCRPLRGAIDIVIDLTGQPDADCILSRAACDGCGRTETGP